MNETKEICLYFLSGYDFEKKHIKGKENMIAYSLTRKLNTNFSSNIQTDLNKRIKTTMENEETYRKLQQKI